MSTSGHPSPYKKIQIRPQNPFHKEKQITPQRWTSPNPERREYHCKQRREHGFCGCFKAIFSGMCQNCRNRMHSPTDGRALGDCLVKRDIGWCHVECNDNEEVRGIRSIQKQYNEVHHGNLLRIEARNESEPVPLLAEDQSKVSSLTREAPRIHSPPSKRQRKKSEDEACSEIVPLDFFDTQSRENSENDFECSDDEARKTRETEEQKRILKHVPRPGDVVCVNALAGCGKTTTISLLCNIFASRNVRVLYLVFGKKNQDEAKNSNKFPRDNMEIRTTHAFVLAHYFGKEQMHNIKSIDRYDLQDIIDKTDLFTECKSIFPKLEDKRFRKRLKIVAGFIRKTIDNFQSSDKDKVSEEHIFWRATTSGKRSQWKKLIDRKKYMSWAQTYFDNVHLQCQRMKNGSVRSIAVPFDTYMKVAQLDKLKIDANVVLIDEAQDMTPCQGNLFWGPEQRERKIIYLFGDRHQQLYRFRGASDSFSVMVKKSEPCLSLTGSFRFGRNIARYATYILTQLGNDEELKGRAKKHGKVLRAPKVMNEEYMGMVVLCRSNIGIFQYLLENEPKRWCSIGNTFVPPTQLKPWVFKLEDFINGKTKDFSYNSEKFNKMADLDEFAADQCDSELMRFIALLKLLNEKGKGLAEFVEQIRQSHSRIKDNESPDDYQGIIVGTVHKAKGLEFKKVLLHADFRFALMKKYLEGHGYILTFTDEANILYVAVTRATEFLYLSPGAESFFAWLIGVFEEGKVMPDIDCTKERETLFERFKKFKSETSPILSLEDIPWPNVVTLGLDRQMSELDFRRYIRALRLKYHPDHFLSSFERRIEDEELKKEVKAMIGEICMQCCALGEFATLNDV